MSNLSDVMARIHSNGNLSLGGEGQDDAAYDSSHKYAKGDVFTTVNPNDLVSDTLPALTYITGDIPVRALAASTTHKVTIPIQGAMGRTFQAATGYGINPHGFKVQSVALAYRVNTTTITSATMQLDSYPLVAAAALPTVTSVTGTVSGNTLTAAANVYLMVFTVTTPAFFTTADTMVRALATIVIPGSSTVDLLGASWRLSVALY